MPWEYFRILLLLYYFIPYIIYIYIIYTRKVAAATAAAPARGKNKIIFIYYIIYIIIKTAAHDLYTLVRICARKLLISDLPLYTASHYIYCKYIIVAVVVFTQK